MAEIQNQEEEPMWPSFETASRLYDFANIALIASLVVGVVATVTLVWMGNIKEAYLGREVAAAGERASTANQKAAEANERTAKAELEIARLSARRLLTPRQEREMAGALAKYPVSHINVLVGSPSVEVLRFATQLGNVFEKAFEIREAKKKPGDADFVFVLPYGGTDQFPDGVVVSHMHGNAEGNAFAKEAIKTLKAFKISARAADAGENTYGDSIMVTVGNIPE